MPKKPSVRTLSDSKHVKGFERLLKSARQYFSNIFWLLWKEISLENCILVVSEVLTLFVNISEGNQLWGSSFLLKYFKVYVDSDNAEKNFENICWFTDKCIWIGCVRQQRIVRWQVFFLSKSDCLTQPIEMQLSQDQKIFPQFFSAFPESA